MPILVIRIRGQLAESIVELIASRYERTTFLPSASTSDTLVIAEDLDSAAERGLLNVFWDAGHEVSSIHSVH